MFKPHPECLEGEVFLSNITIENFNDPDVWKSGRLGHVAYDIYGKAIPVNVKARVDGIFPIFASRKELEDAGIEVRVWQGPETITVSRGIQ